MTNLEVNRTNVVLGKNSLDVFVGDVRVISRIQGNGYLLHTDDLGLISLAACNLIDLQNCLAGRTEDCD